MEVALPKYAAFKHPYLTQYYLEYVHEGPRKGFLRYSSENLVSVYTKFAIEPAKVGHGYFNIRCCYNNKYWAASNDEIRLVTPSVHEPQEDKNTWPCTLFHILKTKSGSYKFYDVRLQNYVGLSIHSNLYNACLATEKGSPEVGIVHTPIDFETLVVMPKYVAFKGDNGSYLQLASYKDKPYLQFLSDDIGHPKVCNQVFTMSNGSVRIMSTDTNKFWRCESNWIRPDSDDKTGSDKNTIFWPTKVSKNIVALRNLGNNCFCKRLTADNKTSCLNAALESITKEAYLEIEEPVISREIYNVKFRLNDAKVKDHSVLTMATADTSNDGTTELNMSVVLRYTKTRTKSWTSMLGASVGITIILEAEIPLIGKSSFSLNETISGSYSWGETLTETEEVAATYSVNVPPKKRMKVSLVVTNGICDVPFTYTKRDTLRSGEQVITVCDDGIFTGVNPYKFQYSNETEDI